ncbi:flagellin [Malikia sp.]|uniref:flagellin N-terminal helical domain-containing protein n=1 Tax=Malikia sp. TaxID=2070706 RepID=UPI0026122393|nr:flagellin [Malikia sp.]MDD2730417.1 flagellin [Malikia sp.]
MAYSINTNSPALLTQRNLAVSQTKLQASIERLSSGVRLNSAKDNAADFAIAGGIETVIRGQGAAVRNVSDAISLAQTADGSLSRMQENLQRMRELAVQAATDTNAPDRAGLNEEFSSLQQEVSHIAHSTKFNGIKVFDGAERTFQVDYANSPENQVKLQGTDLLSPTSSTQKALASPAIVAGAGMELLAQGGSVRVTTQSGEKEYTVQRDSSGRVIGYFDPTAVDAATVKSDMIRASSIVGFDATPIATDASTAALSNFDAFKALQSVGITTREGATAAIDKIDQALKELHQESGTFGAAQNSLGSVLSTLQASVETQTAAKSRIVDTDFAAETSNLARGQIMQQAGMAMLAQANQLPSGLMSLLR